MFVLGYKVRNRYALSVTHFIPRPLRRYAFYTRPQGAGLWRYITGVVYSGLMTGEGMVVSHRGVLRGIE